MDDEDRKKAYEAPTVKELSHEEAFKLMADELSKRDRRIEELAKQPERCHCGHRTPTTEDGEPE